MTLYLVRDGAEELWVALERDDRFYVYDPHTDHFHRSQALWRDFYGAQDLSYDLLEPAAARERVAAGVGGYDGREVTDLLAKHKADPDPLDTAQVLQGGPAQDDAPTARQRADARAQLLGAAGDGEWVVWKTYPLAKKQTARVAASDLRHGKVAALQRFGVGPVETKLVTAQGSVVEVRVRRISSVT